jgi:hypothetical protein
MMAALQNVGHNPHEPSASSRFRRANRHFRRHDSPSIRGFNFKILIGELLQRQLSFLTANLIATTANIGGRRWTKSLMLDQKAGQFTRHC